MASCSRKKNESMLFKANYRPRFFKIILFDSIRDNKLSIPKKFVKTYGDDLSVSSKVTLKVPGGVKWKVEILKSDDEIWLQKGWLEFAEYYSVAHGSFLVFEYRKSDSEFDVIIFDKSCTEIDYPFSFSNPDEHFQEEDVSVEILDHNSPSREKEELEEELSSFQREISSCHLKLGMLKVPYSFIKKMEQETKFIKLKVNHRVWDVNLIFYSKSGLLSAGWTAFARDNSLKLGDVCTFHLIRNTHHDQTPLINVSIIRHMNV